MLKNKLQFFFFFFFGVWLFFYGILLHVFKGMGIISENETVLREWGPFKTHVNASTMSHAHFVRKYEDYTCKSHI